MPTAPHTIPPAERYALLVAAIVPRPIALVSTISSQGLPNLAPFSFFNGVGSDPMTLLFCPAANPDGSDKDTLRNCKPAAEGGTGEFIVHIVPHRLGPQMAAAAEPLPHGESEFALAGLTPIPADIVRPPRVAEAPVAFECRTIHVHRTAPGKPNSGNIVIGEVVAIHVDPAVLDPRGRIDPAKLDAIARMGGSDYCTTRDRFTMPRGREALKRVTQ